MSDPEKERFDRLRAEKKAERERSDSSAPNEAYSPAPQITGTDLQAVVVQSQVDANCVDHQSSSVGFACVVWSLKPSHLQKF